MSAGLWQLLWLVTAQRSTLLISGLRFHRITGQDRFYCESDPYRKIVEIDRTPEDLLDPGFAVSLCSRARRDAVLSGGPTRTIVTRSRTIEPLVSTAATISGTHLGASTIHGYLRVLQDFQAVTGEYPRQWTPQ